jgi:uncharacterized membrane protein
MAPLITLVLSFLAFRAIGLLPASPVSVYFANWHFALRAALGVMFLLTASAHWGKRRPDLMRMVPEKLGNAGMWVSLTGWAELAIALGLQVPKLSMYAAWAAAVLLCCLFPANIKAGREHLKILGQPVLPVLPRLILQIIFLVAVLASI